jgi:hypothetical protein
VALIAYRGVPSGCLVGDDFLHLYQLTNEPLGPLLVRPYAGHLYIVSNLLFLLISRTAGAWDPPYFVAMLLLHLSAVGLLFGIVRVLTGSARIATIAAGTWGAAPLHAPTLAWFSVVGELLALVLSLVAVYGMTVRGAGQRIMTGAMASGLAVALVAAAASFGTGIAVAAISPLLLVLLVPRARRRRSVLGVFAAVPAVVAVLYLACQRASGPAPLDPLGLTFASTQWSGMLLVVRMFVGMLAFGAGRIVLGPLAPRDVLSSEGLTTTLAIGVGVLVVVGAWRVDVRTRAACGALLAAALAQYAIIAVGRAATFVMMNRVGIAGAFGEARYHYAATALLVAALAVGLHGFSAGTGMRRRLGRALALSWLGVAVIGLMWRPIAIETRPGVRNHVGELLRVVNEEVDRASDGAAVYIPNRFFAPVGPLLALAPEAYPGWAAAFTFFFDANVVRGHRVFFVEGNPKVRAAAGQLAGSRIAELLVAPEDGR